MMKHECDKQKQWARVVVVVMMSMVIVLWVMAPTRGMAQGLNLDQSSSGMGYFERRIQSARDEISILQRRTNSLPARVGIRWRMLAIGLLEDAIAEAGSGGDGAIAVETGLRLLGLSSALDQWVDGLALDAISPLSIEAQRRAMLLEFASANVLQWVDVDVTRGRNIDRWLSVSVGPLVGLMALDGVTWSVDTSQAQRRVKVLRESVTTIENINGVRDQMYAMLDTFEDAAQSGQWRPQVMLACRDFESALLLIRRCSPDMQAVVAHALNRTFDAYRDPARRSAAIERLILCEDLSNLFERIESIKRMGVNSRSIELAVKTLIDWVADDDTLEHVASRLVFLQRLIDAVLLGHTDDQSESDHGFSRIKRRLRPDYLDIEKQALHVVSTLFDEIETINQPATTTVIVALERSAATQHHLAVIHEALDAVRRETGERLQPTLAKIANDLLSDDEQAQVAVALLAAFIDQSQGFAWPDEIPVDGRGLRKQWAQAWRMGQEPMALSARYRAIWRKTWITHWVGKGVNRFPAWVDREAVERLRQVAKKTNTPDRLMMGMLAAWHGWDAGAGVAGVAGGVGGGGVGGDVREQFDALVYSDERQGRLDEALLGWKVLAMYGMAGESGRSARLGQQVRDALDRIIVRAIDAELR